RASLNGAVFYQDFDDYITRLARVPISTSQLTPGITDNADAEIYGVELDFNMLLAENWSLGGGLAYVNTQFDDGEELLCAKVVDGVAVIPPGEIAATCDVSGQALGPQPDWSASLYSEYTTPLFSNEAYIRALARHVGEREDMDYAETLDPYQIVDLFLGLRSESGSWDISLFARNLFDEDETIRAAPLGLHRRQPTGYQAVDVVPPRLIGLSASYHF
ncbi:MAG: TonB-dependent receptor domain-containing protein, partial [Gammaproteobacteria bacterium]